MYMVPWLPRSPISRSNSSWRWIWLSDADAMAISGMVSLKALSLHGLKSVWKGKQVGRVIPLLSRPQVFKVQNPQVCILVSYITILHYYLKSRCGVYKIKQPLKVVSNITTLHDTWVLVNIVYRSHQGCILVSKNTTLIEIRALVSSH